MARWLRASAIYIAFVAFIVRSLVPLGWMPNPAGAGPLIVMCSKDGPVAHPFDLDADPSKPDPSHHSGDHHTVCPFNAAPHFAVSATAAVVAVLTPDHADAPLLPVSTALRPVRRHNPQSPRAPPYSV